MNWVEEALFKSYLTEAESKVRRPDLTPLMGDVWAQEHPEEHAADMARYELECQKFLTHDPDDLDNLVFPKLPHYKLLNLLDMQQRYLSMKNG